MKALNGPPFLSGLFVFSFFLAILPSFAADTALLKDRTRQTLLYGIDSQVIDAVQSIRSSQDTSFTPELSQILNGQRSAEVQKAVFDLFREQKIKDGEERGEAIIAAWQDAKELLLIAAIQYLAAITSPGLSSKLSPLVDAGSNGVALAAIGALGASGDKTAAPLLVAKLKSADFPDARKNDCILALGALKDPVAVEVLLSIAGSTDEDKVRRMYAADSLGRIGDARALPVLRTMFAENDALIRLYAAGALSRFGVDDVFPSIVQGLRDGNVKVREQSAKALARELSSSQVETAVPILSYKAELDPEPSVRVASIQALGAIGGDAATKMLLKIYSGADHPLDSRETALGILAAKSLSLSMESIRAVVAKEWSSSDARTLESTAKVLAAIKSQDLKDLFVRFLDSPDPVVRSYGVRGIGANGFSDLRDRVKKISEQDQNSGTRQEAARCLAKL
ncbi:MAG: HEAT repeat domain-containing protein [Spirochaetia bacterium]|jgi:HEAT repeat protein